MLNIKNQKGQVGGIITGLVFGVTSLIIGVIIAYVIISTLTSADLLAGSRTSVSITNETGSINATGYTLTEYSTTNAVLATFIISSVLNATDGTTIDSGNYTLSSGILLNNSAHIWDSVNISYIYHLYSDEELSTEGLVSNLTEGIDNVSSKIPTILLVAAIVLILGVLALLVGMWQKMRLGGGGTSL